MKSSSIAKLFCDRQNPHLPAYSHKFDQVSNNCKVASGQARQLDLVSNSRFLGPFSGASDQSEGQEQGRGAV